MYYGLIDIMMKIFWDDWFEFFGNLVDLSDYFIKCIIVNSEKIIRDWEWERWWDELVNDWKCKWEMSLFFGGVFNNLLSVFDKSDIVGIDLDINVIDIFWLSGYGFVFVFGGVNGMVSGREGFVLNVIEVIVEEVEKIWEVYMFVRDGRV